MSFEIVLHCTMHLYNDQRLITEPLQEMSDSEVVNIGINHPAYKVRSNNDSKPHLFPMFVLSVHDWMHL